MKKIILAAVLLVAINNLAIAQQKVTIGTVIDDTTALLQVNAVNKGMLVPRLTNAQMNAIVSPANGLLVYNTDSAAFAYRNATAWVFLKGNTTASNDWNTKGNTGTDTSTDFIGTTDNVDLVFKRNNQRAGLINESSGNTSWGAGSLNAVSSGSNNTANGYNALYNNTSGNYNTANGLDALYSDTSGSFNTANGFYSLRLNTSGNNNTAMGAWAGYQNTTGFSNVAIGVNALNKNTNRSNIVAVGDNALLNNGMGATQNFEAVKNTAVGSKSLQSNTIGYNNTANGFQSLFSNVDGQGNTAIGNESLRSNVLGNFNTALGEGALRSNISSQNTAIGQQALNATSDGNGNTALGSRAGFSNVSGGGNVFIGYNAGYNETASNKLYISNNNSNAGNTLIYGEFDNKILSIDGKLGIGTTTPLAKLEVVGKIKVTTAAGSTGIDLATSDSYAELRQIRNTTNAIDHNLYFGFNGDPASSINFYNGGLTPSVTMVSQNVGIGTTDPLAKLHVEGAVILTNSASASNGNVGIGSEPTVNTKLHINSNQTYGVYIDGSSPGSGAMLSVKGTSQLHVVSINGTATNSNLYVGGTAANSNLYVGGTAVGYNLFVDGNAAKTDGLPLWSIPSDARLKEQISPYKGGLTELLKIKPVKYHYTKASGLPSNQENIGILAQELKEVAPYMVFKKKGQNTKEEFYNVNLSPMLFMYVNAFKELDAKNKELEEKIARLEALVKTLADKK